MQGCEHAFRLASGGVAECEQRRGHPGPHESASDRGFVVTWHDGAPFDAVGPGRFFVPGEVDPDDMVASQAPGPPPEDLRPPPPDTIAGA